MIKSPPPPPTTPSLFPSFKNCLYTFWWKFNFKLPMLNIKFVRILNFELADLQSTGKQFYEFRKIGTIWNLVLNLNLNLNAIFLVIHSFMLFVKESKWHNESIGSLYLETIVEVSQYSWYIESIGSINIPEDFSGGFSYTPGK